MRTKEEIAALERRLFVRTYESESIIERTIRLEEFVFLKHYSDDLATRLRRLSKALTSSEPVSGRSASPDDRSRPDGSAPLPAYVGAASVPVPVDHSGLIDVINRGIDHYNQHRYHNAEDDFEMTCAMAPGMSRVFAYLAITKLQLNERQAAIDSFRTSYELDPFGTYGRYAKYCLIALAGDDAIRAHAPVDSSKILDGTINKINEQSAAELARHNHEGAVNAHLSAMSAGTHTDSFVQAARARTDGTLRAAFTQESANNLKHLLATKRKPGDANLRAWGTNLTTRYYGTDTYLYAPYYIPREKPLELKAIAASLKTARGKFKPSTSGLSEKGKRRSTLRAIKQ